jgi:thioredoxin-related protein
MMITLRSILTMILLLSIGVASAALPRDPARFFFEETLGDLKDDLQDAKGKGKKGVVIFFEQDECPFCHRMKGTILNQVVVQDYYRERFLVLSIDIESDEELVDFDGNATTKKKYFAKIARNRGATPVFAFFDMDGKMVVRYTGASSGVDEFIWLGEFAAEKHYEKMPFAKYKRMKRTDSRAPSD